MVVGALVWQEELTRVALGVPQAAADEDPEVLVVAVPVPTTTFKISKASECDNLASANTEQDNED